MSEYQVVMFRAVDRPLDEAQLEFMSDQSSRAEFTKWEYEVEYHYSSFRGNVDEMLRHGYDIYLAYSNYDASEIRIRLPAGLPFPKKLWSLYTHADGMTWEPDKKGKAGILKLAPYVEKADGGAGDVQEFLDAATTLRELLISGDLRALYVIWLCLAMDAQTDPEELIEPPVPHGLATIPEQVTNLLPLFDGHPYLVDAAAIGVPPYDNQVSQEAATDSWLAAMSASHRSEIIQRLLSEDPVALKRELQCQIRDTRIADDWPVASLERTLAQLWATCESLVEQEQVKRQQEKEAQAKRLADEAKRKRLKRMIEMKAAPQVWLRKASELVKSRGTDNYREAASILADLRDAVGGVEGTKIARKHAAHLAKEYPTLNVLKSSLRKQQLLD